MIHDYTRKRGIVHSEILLPSNAPPDFQDRGTLWNSVEQIEKACNSQLARELEVALPIELSREEQVRLVRAYCSSQFVSRGMCADFNIHDTGSGNPHAHILLTMRPMDERGKWLPKSKKEYVLDENGERIRLSSGGYKTRKVELVDWNSQENAEVWRKVWADLANEFLERNNRPERIDHRSYERQGIDQIPTVHIGVAASQMEKKGIATERGELNRSIKAANRLLRDIKAQIGKLKEWLLDVFKAKESLSAEPPQSKSTDLSTLLFRYLDIQKANGRKYSQSWQERFRIVRSGLFDIHIFQSIRRNSLVKVGFAVVEHVLQFLPLLRMLLHPLICGSGSFRVHRVYPAPVRLQFFVRLGILERHELTTLSAFTKSLQFWTFRFCDFSLSNSRRTISPG